MNADMGWSQLPALAAAFGQVSLIAVGGVISVIPEIQRQVVELHGWMDPRLFGALFALAQAAPGPNMLLVTLVGWHVAGLAGALVATGALVLPASLLAYVTSSLWRRFRDWPWLREIQRGLNAVSVGLIAAAAVLLGRAAAVSSMAMAILAVSAVLLTTTRIHPLWVLGASAALGALELV